MLLYTDQASGFAIAILVLSGAVGLLVITSAYADSQRANAWISTAAFLNLIASGIGAGFIYAIANIVDLGKVDVSIDAGQSVELGVPSPLLAMMPIAELLLLQGLHAFKSNKL